MWVLNIFMILLTTGIVRTTNAAGLPEVDNISVSPELDDIPTLVIAGIWDTGMNVPSEKSIKDLRTQKYVEDACEKNGGQTAYNGLQESLKYYHGCLSSVGNVPQLKEDEAAAVSQEKRDTVFEKYCYRILTLTRCVDPLLEGIKPCLESEQRNRLTMLHNISVSIMEFFCNNDGNRLASFVAADGMECLVSRKTDFLNCTNAAFVDYPLPNDGKKLLSENSGLKECTDIDAFRNCTVSTMENCTNPVLVSVTKAGFDFYRKISSCQKVVDVAQPARGRTPYEDEMPESINRQKCAENGGPEAYETADEGIKLVSKIFRILMDRPQLNADTAHNQYHNDQRDGGFQRYCQRMPIMIELMKYSAESMKPCLKPEERRSLDIMYEIGIPVLESMCFKERDDSEKFIFPYVGTCFSMNENALINCATRSFASYIPDRLPDTKLPMPSTMGGEIYEYALRHFVVPRIESEKLCTDLDKFRDCSNRLTGMCPDEISSKVLNSMINSVSGEIPCNNDLGGNPPPALVTAK